MTGLVLREFAAERDAADGCQNEENKARNFEPELVRHASERAQRDAPGLPQGDDGPTFSGMPTGNVGQDAQL